MRLLLPLILCLCSLLARADEHELLYQLAGWGGQRQHFSSAIDQARQKYRSSLPPALFQQLDATAQRRFEPQAMRQRMLDGLRQQLPDPLAAIRFFDGPTGRAVVAAELAASDPAEVSRQRGGVPLIEVSPARQALLERLARALPAREAGVEMGMAVSSLAAESLGGLLGGLGADPAMLLEGQRQQLAARIEKDLPLTLRWVYRKLSDAQLAEFVAFAESDQGGLYYQAAIRALRQALAG